MAAPTQPAGMSRRHALRNLAGAALLPSLASLSSSPTAAAAAPASPGQPLALTMWDFSWLERRWTGAGYEDWDLVLSELVERGYNAVRIDAYPHLVAAGAETPWHLVPVWNQHDWGSPGPIDVIVMPALLEFIAACRHHGVRVGLSSWFREDITQCRMKLDTPEKLADAWIATLQLIDDAGLLDAVFYTDLCNEWPGLSWAPFFRNDPLDLTWGGWHTETSMAWMNTALARVRAAFPDMPLCFSFDNVDTSLYGGRDLSTFDLVEHHCWVAKENGMEMYRELDYNWDNFSDTGYRQLSADGGRIYHDRPDYWQSLLVDSIHRLADGSRRTGLPFGTSECWGIINYKDYPGLDWGWVKELCALGTETAAATGRWAFISTSNFCGPQFAGMWRDVAWHQRLTQIIKSAPLEADLIKTKLVQRLAG
jgi:hypothetical protein